MKIPTQGTIQYSNCLILYKLYLASDFGESFTIGVQCWFVDRIGQNKTQFMVLDTPAFLQYYTKNPNYQSQL